LDSQLETLRQDAARLSSDEFTRRHPAPVLLLNYDEDWADFHTSIRSTAEILAGAEEEAAAKEVLAVREIVKSDRNPYADRISVGRASSNDIVIKHPSVSKLHGHFVKHATGGLAVRDASSTNGVYVNGKKLADGVPGPIKSGDTLTIGRVEAKFYQPAGLFEHLRSSKAR
jgi:hypothetical protein